MTKGMYIYSPLKMHTLDLSRYFFHFVYIQSSFLHSKHEEKPYLRHRARALGSNGHLWSRLLNALTRAVETLAETPRSCNQPWIASSPIYESMWKSCPSNITETISTCCLYWRICVENPVVLELRDGFLNPATAGANSCQCQKFLSFYFLNAHLSLILLAEAWDMRFVRVFYNYIYLDKQSIWFWAPRLGWT